MYRDMAAAVEAGCYAVDPVWLIDHHPALWERMIEFDNQLAEMERTEAAEPQYRLVLEHLITVVRQARALFEQERKQPEPVQH